ncbi:MAG: deoxyribonuclease IV [Parcubacteria group bacterium Licking1014_17]|nr:MAG: deoxyribonuclease IV [Parcubacteria group bacterium Licking1014_17]
MTPTNKIGTHISIKESIIKAPSRAVEEGCETFQCFTRPPQGGPAPEISPEIAEKFKSELKKNKMDRFYIHAPYFINLASLEPRIRYGSISVLREELERGSVLGAKYLMTHLGSYKGRTEKEGLEKVIDGIKKVLDDYDGDTKFLIEMSAGSGDIMGDTIDDIATIVTVTKSLNWFGGVCFDTCHSFAAGYNFVTIKDRDKMMTEFSDKVGIDALKLVHVNDSVYPLGSKKDRHEHIGKGEIGEEGLAILLKTKEFSQIDWIIETEGEGRQKDIEILKKIRNS